MRAVGSFAKYTHLAAREGALMVGLSATQPLSLVHQAVAAGASVVKLPKNYL